MQFVADVMLGKLAKWMRILGYDTIYYHRMDRGRVLRDVEQGRVLLTRSNRWKGVIPADRLLFIEENDPREQIREVLNGLDLHPDRRRILERCIVCNHRLDAISKEEAEGKVPEYIRHNSERFLKCPFCDRIYWQGSHRNNMLKEIQRLLQEQ